MKNTVLQIGGVPFISIGMVCVNVVVHMVDHFAGGRLLLAGNLNLTDVMINRETERLFWAMFLHADLNHLFNNMIIVLFMGNILEKAVGHFAFGGVYMLAGLFGNVCSLLYKMSTDPWSRSVGASGAVFGMDGLLLALLLLSNGKKISLSLTRMIVMVFLSLYSGFANSNIDNAAHLGGLIMGFVAGCIVCIVQRIKYKYK